jgi:hypothetical protein
MSRRQMTKVEVNLPLGLYQETLIQLEKTGGSFSDWVRIQMRRFAHTEHFGLMHPITFGKFNGETIEALIRNEPAYMKWLVEKADRPIRLDEEAVALYRQLINPKWKGHS